MGEPNMSPELPERVSVTGLGVSGPPVVRALLARGVTVTVVDARDDATTCQRAEELRELGAEVVLGATTLPPATQLVVTSPGWRPDSPMLLDAQARGVSVIGDVELAWRLRPSGQCWLGVTGTNGKTTVVRMLEAMLRADGRHTQAVGNVGTPIISAVASGVGSSEPAEFLVVELSSFQLHWSCSVTPHAAVVLNVAADHVDWHGDMAAYAAAKGKIYAPGTIRVVNPADPTVVRLAERDGDPTSPLVAITDHEPEPGQLGVVAGALVERTQDSGRTGSATETGAAVTELARVADIRPAAAHSITNALAAAALARSVGVRPEAIRQGLLDFTPEPHRVNVVATVAGVCYVNDSKATNPHAAAASLAAYQAPVWIAGGLLKGAAVDDLVAGAADRLRAVVLLGADRRQLRSALDRHAPHVPVIEVERVDDEAMTEVVTVAASLAATHGADTVLLAPAAASMDMFSDYAARGSAYAHAVQQLSFVS